MSSFDQKPRAKRRIRVVELWALGFTAEETVLVMRDEEGYRTSVATVYRDRHSTDAQEYLDTLITRQLRDIAQADITDRLRYRDALLGKLMPQKMMAFSESRVTIRQEVPTVDLSDLDDGEREELRRIARRIELARNTGEE